MNQFKTLDEVLDFLEYSDYTVAEGVELIRDFLAGKLND